MGENRQIGVFQISKNLNAKKRPLAVLSEVRHGNRSVFNIKCLESVLVIWFSTAYSIPYLLTFSVSICI